MYKSHTQGGSIKNHQIINLVLYNYRSSVSLKNTCHVLLNFKDFIGSGIIRYILLFIFYL